MYFRQSTSSGVAAIVKEEFEYLIWLSLRHAPLITDTLASLLDFLEKPEKTLADLHLISPPKKNIAREENRLIDGSPLFSGSKNNRDNFDNREPTTIADAIWQLIKCLQQHRCLIVLDEWETVLSANQLAGSYGVGYQDYGELLKQVGSSEHQSCLLLTSTDKPREIAALEGKNLSVRSLKLWGLGEAAREILRDKGLPEIEQYSNLIKVYSGNPLALKIVATTIQDMFGGSIAQFLSQELFLGDFSDRIAAQFHRLTLLEQQILRTIAPESQPFSYEELRWKISSYSYWEFSKSLESLVRRSLVETANQESVTVYTLQPLVRSYVLSLTLMIDTNR